MTQSEICLEGQAEGDEGHALERKNGLNKKLEIEMVILYFGD